MVVRWAQGAGGEVCGAVGLVGWLWVKTSPDLRGFGALLDNRDGGAVSLDCDPQSAPMCLRGSVQEAQPW